MSYESSSGPPFSVPPVPNIWWSAIPYIGLAIALYCSIKIKRVRPNYPIVRYWAPAIFSTVVVTVILYTISS